MGFDHVFCRIKKLFKGEKAAKALIIAGIVGIVLISLSTFLEDTPEKTAQTATESDTAGAAEDYSTMLEEELGALVADITASPNVRVFVTLESGTEYVYANEIKQGTDVVEDTQNDSGKKVQQKDSTEQNYILVEDADGRQTALLVTERTPKVQGVTVVCDKGDQPEVAEKITDAITTALHITSRRVCVTGRAAS